MLSEEIFNVSSEKIIKENYLEIKKQYDDIKDRICKNKIHVSELLYNEDVNAYLELINNKNVTEYIETCDEIEKLNKEKNYLRDRLEFLHQHLCEHPAYFVLENEKKSLGEEFITCSCIECEKKLTRRIDNIDDIYLIYPKNMDDAEIEYKKYKKEYKKALKRIS